MTDSGKCTFVLGIELVDGPDGSVTMCQRRYVDDILKRFGMDECKAVVSPVDISTRLISSDAATKVNAPFREAVGALMHLMTATRPDIAYAVGYVSRFMENPQEEHWVAVKRIFRYLQGTKTHGICFKPGDNIDFRGYSDADWAGDLADRKSTSGYTFMLMGAPVSWGSKKQSSVSLSTSEAEYIALILRVTGLVSVIDREPVSSNRSNPNPRRLRHRGLRHCRLRHLWVQDCRYKMGIDVALSDWLK
ncbi:hypothetical protein PC118_g24293 [Phytophthora cactorum]|uniref:Reverse transcriptase Ty1/copia-type domain-containing protein n=2 Tax=Phytophthora cactorum TaxID=29920 RepID=A0A8T1EXV2_9STRA|nr:hypothetical protein PC118_g24293 [Phytophthora cactorum]